MESDCACCAHEQVQVDALAAAVASRELQTQWGSSVRSWLQVGEGREEAWRGGLGRTVSE